MKPSHPLVTELRERSEEYLEVKKLNVRKNLTSTMPLLKEPSFMNIFRRIPILTELTKSKKYQLD